MDQNNRDWRRCQATARTEAKNSNPEQCEPWSRSFEPWKLNVERGATGGRGISWRSVPDAPLWIVATDMFDITTAESRMQSIARGRKKPGRTSSHRPRNGRSVWGSRQMRNQGTIRSPQSRHAWVDDDVDVEESTRRPDIRHVCTVFIRSRNASEEDEQQTKSHGPEKSLAGWALNYAATGAEGSKVDRSTNAQWA